MKIEIVWRSDPERPVDDPLLEKNGFIIRFVRGSYCDPMNGSWFGPKWPTIVLRYEFTRMFFPFISWRLGTWSGYAGAKIYPVHHEEYKNWLPPAEVYEGSMAFCFTIRPFATSEP